MGAFRAGDRFTLARFLRVVGFLVGFGGVEAPAVAGVATFAAGGFASSVPAGASLADLATLFSVNFCNLRASFSSSRFMAAGPG